MHLSKKTLAVVTIVYNEAKQLHRWLAYYLRQVESPSDIYILDHGSNDGSTDNFPAGVNCTRLPRVSDAPLDEHWRVGQIATLAEKLLETYLAVVCVDCDEILVVDPLVARTLKEYVQSSPPRALATRAMGFEVLHDFTIEPALASSLVTSVRNKLQFVKSMCKSVLFYSRRRWFFKRTKIHPGAGFHLSNFPPKFGPLFLFHLRYADLDEGLERLATTRKVSYPILDNTPKNHQKISDSEFKEWLASFLEFPLLDGDIALSAEDGRIKQLIDGIEFELKKDRLYHFDISYRADFLLRIPERFRGFF